MAEDPHVREIGRVTDGSGHVIIIGAGPGTVTLQTLSPAAVVLGPDETEEFSQKYLRACWQAGWQQGTASRDGEP